MHFLKKREKPDVSDGLYRERPISILCFVDATKTDVLLLQLDRYCYVHITNFFPFELLLHFRITDNQFIKEYPGVQNENF